MLTLKHKVVTETYDDVPLPESGPRPGGGKYVHLFTEALAVHIPGTLHGLGTADLFLQAYTADSPRQALSTVFSIDDVTADVLVMFTQAQSGRMVLLT